MSFDWERYSTESGAEDVPLLLSVRSQSLVLAAMQSLEFRSNWLTVDDATWDDIEKSVGEAYEEVMEIVSQMGTFSGETVWRSTDQTMTANQWNSISFDSGINSIEGYWQLSPNPTRLTALATGIHIFGGAFLWAANSSGDTGTRRGRILRNGTEVLAFDAGSIVSQGIPMNMTRRTFLQQGDYIELQAFSSIPNLVVLTQDQYSPIFWIELLREQ